MVSLTDEMHWEGAARIASRLKFLHEDLELITYRAEFLMKSDDSIEIEEGLETVISTLNGLLDDTCGIQELIARYTLLATGEDVGEDYQPELKMEAPSCTCGHGGALITENGELCICKNCGLRVV